MPKRFCVESRKFFISNFYWCSGVKVRGMLSDNKDLKVPEKPKLKCMGFTYNGAKLFNMLPPQTKETKDTNTYLQNYDEKLDMGKHPFILVITIYFIHAI